MNGDQVTINRELVSQVVWETWVAYCREVGDDKPVYLAPWEDLGEQDREVDRSIGERLTRNVIHALLGYLEIQTRWG